MNNVAFVFPGQGSQVVAMGKELAELNPEVMKVFNLANEILGIDLKKVIFDGPIEELTKTEIAQPALLTTSIAIYQLLKKVNISPLYCAGHSLGEFTAHVCAGTLTFEDGLKAVRERGLLMANADKDGKGSMAAIIGLDDAVVEDICNSLAKDGVIMSANYNCPGQLVISGEKTLIFKAIEIAKEKKAKIAKELNVSGAFHSPLVAEASKGLEKFLNSIKFHETSIKVISNVTADVVDLHDIKNILVNQLKSPVLWKKSIEKMGELGITTFVEIGAGKVLQGLIKKIIPSATTLGIENSVTLQTSLEKLK